MLEKFYTKRMGMFPLEPDIYWRLMRQHKLSLIEASQEQVLTEGLFTPSKYSFYRYFLNIELDAKLWIPTLVASGIDNIEDYVDINQVIKIPNISVVESIIASVN